MLSDQYYYTAAAVYDGNSGHFGKIRMAYIRVSTSSGHPEVEASDILLREKSSLHRAELEVAVLCAEAAPEGATICTFSEYVHAGVTKWMTGWAANRWHNKKGQEVKNKDLWQRMLDVAASRKIHWLLDLKNAPISKLSQAVLDLAQSGCPLDLDEGDEDESDVGDQESFVVPQVECRTPINYGGW